MDPVTAPLPHPVTATWRDQLIELDLPGVGPITACADPRLVAEPPVPDPSADVRDEQGIAHRRREPTVPPEEHTVLATLADRPPLELAHSWLVVPALGPVLPALGPEDVVIADLSGRTAPYEVRSEPAARPVRPSHHRWFRRIAVAAALRRRGGPVALGALVGSRRDWFEPAAAAREDLLAAHPDQALESALRIAVDQGQGAVLRLGPGGLDVIPTGADPRVPALDGLPLRVTARPARCPLQGCDGAGPCRPVGGPWIRRAQEAQLDWEARRSQALAVQDCGVCFGEALPPEPDQPPVPRLARRTEVGGISRLHLRGGEVVRIDPIHPPR